MQMLRKCQPLGTEATGMRSAFQFLLSLLAFAIISARSPLLAAPMTGTYVPEL